MRVSIRDKEALNAVTPEALSAYARGEGWIKAEPYGDYSDVYTKDGGPEIILPQSQRIGDYANVMSQLIEIFARNAEVDELSLYRDLVAADRDVIRVRVDDGGKGDVAVNAGVNLMVGARDMLLAAACSLWDRQPVYRAGDEASKEASHYLDRMRLGQTEQGSFVITLLTPPLDQEWESAGRDPIHRQITHRLAGALAAARGAIERSEGKDDEPFLAGMENGLSSNFCQALVKMINPVPALDVSLAWARTLPLARKRTPPVRFAKDDVPVLRKAVRSFHDLEYLPSMRLVGAVVRLESDEIERGGTMILRATIDRTHQQVSIVLNQSDYQRALQAHAGHRQIIAEGDLRRVGRRWSLLDPHIEEVLPNGDIRPA